MQKGYKFRIGQKVRIYDYNFEDFKTGEVVDNTRDTTFILWEDQSEPEEVEQSDYEKISLVN